MTDETMSPLRRRMIEDMTIRKLAPKTQQGYIRTVKDGNTPQIGKTGIMEMSVSELKQGPAQEA
jgi:hypothetical protein